MLETVVEIKRLSAKWFLSAILYLGLCSSACAQDLVTDSAAHKDQASSDHPLLTKQEIIDGYHTGLSAGATHMLVVWDTWDFEDSYEFLVYSYPHENVNDLIKYYDAPGFYRVAAVFAMHLNLSQ